MTSFEIFNKKTLREKFFRSNRDDFLVNTARAILQDNLLDINKNFQNVLEITRFDEVIQPPANTIDLATSTLHLHFMNDIVGVLTQIKNSLTPDGFFIANFFGGECLKELNFCFQEAEKNSISPRISPMIDARDAGALLQRTGFALPVVTSEKIEVTYEDAFHLMHHLRKIGETNSLLKQRKNFTTRSFLNRVNEIYKQNFSDDEGRITATFELITISGWKPHESQQKPLARGTAKVSLKELLERQE